MFDQARGAGATIRRMLDYLFAELEQADTLLANDIAIRSFKENLALCLLLGLPHNYTERLQRQKTAAAPGNVRRAEGFIQTNASKPLTIAEIAEAAGCGVRALQIAFQQFRGTTPMRVLQHARLEQARTEILRPAKINPWLGLPPSTASAVRRSSPSSSGANMASIPRRCCEIGA